MEFQSNESNTEDCENILCKQTGARQTRKQNTHLIHIHDGENRIIQEFCFTEKGNFKSLILFSKDDILVS